MSQRIFRVVVAPSSFKGSIAATEAAAAIARGVKAAGAEPIVLPVADGGGGTLDALIAGAGGTIMGVIARGPLGVPVRAHLGRLNDGTGVVESAQASGLALVPPKERDVMRASSYGTGELVKGALARRPQRVIVGLGDSATCDGGVGLASALGIRFLDEEGKRTEDLARIVRIDRDRLDARLSGVALVAAADVSNPLLGPSGAAPTFAPQKGADPEQVVVLERGLENLAAIIERDLGVDVGELAGGGAAGGCAAMLAALGATIRKGAQVVLEALRFADRIAGSDLVITGEGRIDEQSKQGKAPCAVLACAQAAGIPCAAIAGSATISDGFDDVRTLTAHFGEEAEAIKRVEEGLEAIARRMVAEWIRRPL